VSRATRRTAAQYVGIGPTYFFHFCALLTAADRWRPYSDLRFIVLPEHASYDVIE